MFKIKLYLALLMGLILLPATHAEAMPSPPASMQWGLHWSDEFSGSSLNTSIWRPYHNTYGDGNNELACLTPNNVSVSGGTLKITARREQVTCPSGSTRQFTSGFLGTRENSVYFPRYAYYEIRAKLPHAQGLWPAFWLRHRNGSSTAEVDIMEYFHSQVPGRTSATLHLDGRSNLSKSTIFFEQPTQSPNWHRWGVHIEDVSGGIRFRFYLNGSLYHTYTDTQANWDKNFSQENLFDIAINLAVGGNWVGHPDDPLGLLSDLNRCSQSGVPPNCTSTGIVRASFPMTYEVDYVRIYTLSNVEQDTTPGDSNGTSATNNNSTQQPPSGGSSAPTNNSTVNPTSPNTESSAENKDEEVVNDDSAPSVSTSQDPNNQALPASPSSGEDINDQKENRPRRTTLIFAISSIAVACMISLLRYTSLLRK